MSGFFSIPFLPQKSTIMRSIILLTAIAACGVCISCNSKSGGMSDAAKKNLAANDSITKAYETGQFDKLKDYIAADAVDHGGEKGDVVGLDSIISEMKRYRDMMPDMKGTVIRNLADDEYVFSWSKVSGTMNGKAMNMTSLDVSKFKDGKAVEHWVYMDPKDMMMMMPGMAEGQMPTAESKDTTANK